MAPVSPVEAFMNWAREPCPAGEWVYRGQPARFRSVTPAMLREPHRGMYAARGLFHIDLAMAGALFESSPVFLRMPLFADLIADETGKQIEEMAYAMLGGPPTTLPNLSFAEIVRALAQHYDFPTLFVDVSFHPIVAAMFATHESLDRDLAVREEPATVYRWAATRRSPARLLIENPGSVDDAINVIDITEIHPAMARPKVQHAGLATPVYDPKPVYQPFSSPIDQLEFLDLADIPSCETFELPPGSGAEIERIAGVGMRTFYPDRVDLGYSYMSMVALLSLVAHQPADDTDLKRDEADALRSSYDDAVMAGRTLLDRECLRLVPDSPVTDVVHQHTVIEAVQIIRQQAEAARLAVDMMGSRKIARRTRRRFRKRQREMRREAAQRFDAWAEAAEEVYGEEVADELRREGPPAYTVRPSSDHAWLPDEIDRRLDRLDRMLESVDRMPVYALMDPDGYGEWFDAFDRDPPYEAASIDLTRHITSWMAGTGSNVTGGWT